MFKNKLILVCAQINMIASLLLLLLSTSMIEVTQAAVSPTKELKYFSKASKLYDDLSIRKSGCDLRIDKHIVLFCNDGYLAVNPLDEFIQISSTKLPA